MLLTKAGQKISSKIFVLVTITAWNCEKKIYGLSKCTANEIRFVPMSPVY